MPTDELLSSLGRVVQRERAERANNSNRSQEQEPPPLPRREHQTNTIECDDDDDATASRMGNNFNARVTKSKKIPVWLWILIAKSLGIKLHPNDKPVISSILHLLTVGTGAGMVFTNMFYAGYDIMSVFSPTDVVDGTVSIIMCSFFAGLGVYSHRLAYRLFVHPKFLQKMRLHSKTMMKVNAALLVLIVIGSFVVVQNLSLARFAYFHSQPLNSTVEGGGGQANVTVSPCEKIEIPVVICQSFYLFHLLFSLFFLVWTVMVAVVLISVARTHTIDIRRFMCELAYDAHLYDKQFRKNFYQPNSNGFSDNLKEYLWVDSDHIGNMVRNATQENTIDSQHKTTEEPPITDDVSDPAPPPPASSAFSSSSVQLQFNEDDEEEHPRRPSASTSGGDPTKFRPLSEEKEEDDDELPPMVPHFMSEQEIMHKYWKLVSSTRLTSLAFQRWMCVVTVTILFWSTMRVVYWLSHSPTLCGVFSFVLPLLLLPLLASSYAEVNYEGIKVIQNIMPTPERIHMFQYLYGMPVQLTAYGHRISYGTMGTVLAGILAAFASKILLQEMGNIIN